MVADTQFQKVFLLYTEDASPSNSFDAGKQTVLKQGRQQDFFLTQKRPVHRTKSMPTSKPSCNFTTCIKVVGSVALVC
jgi:hypothetical protein